MPVSAAPFVSKTVTGFLPATPASVVSGTATATATAAGNYGMSLGNSATVKMIFPIGGVKEPAEKFPPYQQYNAPLTHNLNQNFLTVYYTVAGATLTSMTIGVYAVNYPGAAAGVVQTLLTQATNGLTLPVGTYAVQVPISGLPAINVPYTSVVVELDIATASGGTAVINGVALS